MPTSNYSAFDVKIDNLDGTETLLAAQLVKVRDVTGAADLSDLTSDANGHIPAGTLSIAVGSKVRFRVQSDGNGRAGYAEQITT